MDTQSESTQKLTIRNSAEGQSLFGPHDTYIKIIEVATSVKTVMRGEEITVFGNKEDVDSVIHLLQVLLTLIRKGIVLTERDFRYAFDMAKEDRIDELIELYGEEIATTFKGKPIRVKTLGQRHYITAVKKRDVVFGIGPAGTGKTYLAVVMAVMALKNGQVKRIVLTRPAVEAGENL
ncbi:MAG: PhoH family protein, partial [Bacilli bacterium]